ncbi:MULTISPECIES: glycosyltransferase [Psychrilyobacter]|uniref:glycosyltransferase n=1 Tax=Psychrilyobacter TaxID=623282 RepID=UPI001313FBFF|nr:MULTISPECIES: glycosyltransferase [Psychrilyobacter]MCS5421501.1 glycosyltransferase [Psychrilyobacter sp. S5]NDI76523.1 glycosyltransferase family 4 protein [Psychrilyobacter piezotolerans]
MEILFWHGYLLRGSGSNVFTLNIVEEFLKENNVYLFSQERNWGGVEDIGSHWVMDADQNLSLETNFKDDGFIGVTPYIGDLLPVFVYDEYDGFKVKTFDNLTDEELERYIDLNVKAMISFLKKNKIDIIYCNHFAIAPYIMKKVQEKTGVPYIVIGHGSSLNYIISRDKRYMNLSYEGFLDSKNVVVQSEYIRDRSCEIYERTEFFRDTRFKIIPSGVNFEQFNRLLKDKEVKNIIEEKVSYSNGPIKKIYDENYEKVKKLKDIEEIKKLLDEGENVIEYRDIDRDLISKLSENLRGEEKILYIGKLIISKGVHILLMSLPYIFQNNPTTNITIVGYGKFRPALEILLRGLIDGNKELLEIIIEKGNYLEEKKHGKLKYLSKFWNSLKECDKLDKYLELAKKIDLDRVVFLGKLDHDTLPHVIKKHSVIVVPSIFPESFGMVSIEGMSQGLVPVVFNHSGLKEVIPFKDSLVNLDGEVVNNLEKVVNLNLEKLGKVPNLNKKFIAESKKYSFESVAKRLLDLR